jgi:uncharacterized protein (TIGR03435 family)
MRVILFSVLICAIAVAQTPDSQIAFEVATLKPSAAAGMGPLRIGNRGGPGTADPGRFTCERCNLAMLVSTAYDINYVQISGPSWLSETQFDLVAKVPEGATKAQFRVMMQNLLIDRFKLAVHRDKKEAQIYELSVAKGGPKLKASAGPEDPGPEDIRRGQGGGVSGLPPPPPRMARDTDGFPQLPPGRHSMMAMAPGRMRWRLADESMEAFSKSLQGMVGRPVNDATGLTGKYDFELTFAPAANGMDFMGRGLLPGPMARPPGANPAGPDGAATPPDDSVPSIFTAIQDQLGLKLESKKGPVDTLVIDHIEKTPTEN